LSREDFLGNQGFILAYVQGCVSGTLSFSECAPVWQFGVIVALLACATVLLIMLRYRAYTQTA